MAHWSAKLIAWKKHKDNKNCSLEREIIGVDKIFGRVCAMLNSDGFINLASWLRAKLANTATLLKNNLYNNLHSQTFLPIF